MKRKRAFTCLMVALTVVLAAILILCAEIYLFFQSDAQLPTWGWRDPVCRPQEQNQLGFRGKPISYVDQDFVVVLLGDSFVQADACPFEMMPERRLQYHLESQTRRPVRVFSIGASGYGQDQELFALKEYFRFYRADLVVLWQTPANDVWNNMFPTHWPRDGKPKPTYWLDGQGRLQGPHAEWGRSLYGRSRLWGKIRWMRRPSPDADWERTYLPPPHTPLPAGEPIIDTTDWNLDPREDFLREKTHFILNMSPVSERTRYGIRLTNLLMASIRETAVENQAAFITFLPNSDDQPPDGFYPVEREDPGKGFVRFEQHQYWQSIFEMNRDLPFLIIPVTVRPFRVSDTDSHLNCPATDQVMRDLAAALDLFTDGRAGPSAMAVANAPKLKNDDPAAAEVNLVTSELPDMPGFRELEGPYPDWGIPHQVRWMKSRRAEIGLHHGGSGTLTRRLMVRARTSVMPQRFTVYANGRPVLTASFAETDSWYTWTSAPFAVRPGDNRLAFEAIDLIRPAADSPPLYVLFEEIRLMDE